MKSRTFNSFISWLLIVSSICWTSGCYATTQILGDDSRSGIEIPVWKTNGEQLDVVLGCIDSLGGIKGHTWKKTPSKTPHYFDYALDSIAISRDSIRTASLGEVHVLTTSGQSYHFDNVNLENAGKLKSVSRPRVGLVPQTGTTIASESTEIFKIDSVRALSVTRVNAGKTAWLVTGIVLGVGLIAGATYLAISLDDVAFYRGLR